MLERSAELQPINIAIIDDHDVVHAGVHAWSAVADPPIRVIGAFLTPAAYLARTAASALAAVDVVILDLQFDGKRPDFEALDALVARDERVIVFSLMTADEIILQCLDRGAVTYLVKTEGRSHLVEAIHAAAAGICHTGPAMARAMLHDAQRGRVKLSDREREVLRAWFHTESKDLVAQRLFVTPATVKTHLQRARAKYAAVGRKAGTKSALLARAVEDGILGISEL